MSILRSVPIFLGLRFGFCFAKTGDTISLLPLVSFLQQFNALEPLEYIAFCPQ